MKRSATLVCLALGLAGTACSGFDSLDITFKSAPPDNATVTFEQIRIHEGIAVGITARPMDGDEQMDEDTQLVLESRNPGVLGVAPGEQDDQDEDPEDRPPNYNFVLFGAKAGTTSVVVLVDGDIEAEIPAVVEPQ